MSSLKVGSIGLLLVLLTGIVIVMPFRVSSVEANVEVKIRTINLNEEPLYNMTVQVYNTTASSEVPVDSGETDQDGWVTFTLSNNTYYSFAAFWEKSRVGILPEMFITSDLIINRFNCSLAKVKLTVMTEGNFPLPFIDLNVTYSYLAGNETTINGGLSITDQSGTLVLENMFVNANYTIEARRYGFLFNKTVISNLTPLLKGGWANVVIKPPICALAVKVLDSDKMPIPRARVEVNDLNRLAPGESTTTSDTGNASLNLSFGKYTIQIYYDDLEIKRSVLLNETVVDLIKDRSLVIHCEVFNIQPSVKVTDYLGQPVPNVTVEIEQRLGEKWVKIELSRKTGSNGVALLPSVGGDYRVSVYVFGEVYETRVAFIDRTKQIMFKLDGWTLIGGLFIPTGQLATIILLALLCLSLGLIILYKKNLQKVTEKETAY